MTPSPDVRSRTDRTLVRFALDGDQVNYALSLFRKNGAKLKLIGWGARRAPATPPDTVPGQVGHLVVQHEGKNAVSLSWRDPLDGGEVAAYRIQRLRADQRVAPSDIAQRNPVVAKSPRFAVVGGRYPRQVASAIESGVSKAPPRMTM